MQKKPTDPTQLSLPLFGEVETTSSNNELILAKLGKQIRTGKHPKTGNPCVLAMDLIGAWTDSPDPRTYWKVLKHRLISEGNQTVTNCNQLKFLAEDGKMRMMDVLEIEDALRVMQSIPSPKAEPIKQWLAQLGKERIEETIDPELGVNRSIDRAVAEYKRRGKDDKWIEKRLRGKFKRRALTDYWQAHGIDNPKHYAILTNIIHKTATGGYDVKDHKKELGLPEKANLRDYVSATMLSIIDLSETATEEIAKERESHGFHENKDACLDGGKVGNAAMKVMESITGKSLVTGKPLLSA